MRLREGRRPEDHELYDRAFAVFWEHARADDDTTLEEQLEEITLAVDESARTVRLRHAYLHGLLAPNQGSVRVQSNGNVFVGWGGAGPVFSEFSPGGRLLLDGRLTAGKGNYRAIRAAWPGRPERPPAVTAVR